MTNNLPTCSSISHPSPLFHTKKSPIMIGDFRNSCRLFFDLDSRLRGNANFRSPIRAPARLWRELENALFAKQIPSHWNLMITL